MPWNPKFDGFRNVKMPPKLGRSTYHDQNLTTSSEDGQDTSGCQLSGHPSQVFSRKCLETANSVSSDGGPDTSACQIWCHTFHVLSIKCRETSDLICFTTQNAHKIREMNRPWQKSKNILQVVRIHQHAIFQAIINMHTSSKCTEPPNLTCFIECLCLCDPEIWQKTLPK